MRANAILSRAHGAMRPTIWQLDGRTRGPTRFTRGSALRVRSASAPQTDDGHRCRALRRKARRYAT
jgi:hypothetical protein